MNAPRVAALALGSLLWLMGPTVRSAEAVMAPWETAPQGPNQVVYTLDLICTTGGLVCDALDAYSDQQTAELVGAGELDVDVSGGTLRFLTDGFADLFDGVGPRPIYTKAAASDLIFEPIPFIGAPATESGVVFGLTAPLFEAGVPLSPGLYPISAVVSYSAIADIVGPVDAYLPALLLAPSDVTLSGTLEVVTLLQDGLVYAIRDMTASINVQNPTTLLGENVTVSVTADLTMNLVGFVGGAPTTAAAPGLGGFGVGALVLALGLAGTLASRAGPGAAIIRSRNEHADGRTEQERRGR